MTLFKATHASSGGPAKDFRLEATVPVPDRLPGEGPLSPTWEQDWQAFYTEQARFIVDAMFESLPGGTNDQVLAELCRRKAVLLRVPFGKAAGAA